VTSDAPALILSGAIDPITPPQWGEEIRKALPNSLHLVAVNTSHNVAPVGCAPDLITQFIDQGHLEGLDGSCLDEIERPSFFVDGSGPVVAKGPKGPRKNKFRSFSASHRLRPARSDDERHTHGGMQRRSDKAGGGEGRRKMGSYSCAGPKGPTPVLIDPGAVSSGSPPPGGSRP
jgi:hypothetical protein